MAWRNHRRTIVSLLSVVLIAGSLAMLASREGESAVAYELGTGSAWLMSRSSGNAALVNGGTGIRVTRVHVAAENSDVSVVQNGNNALVLNRDAGTVTRLDGSTWQASVPVDVGTPGDHRLSVHTAGDVGWVVGQQGSVVQQLDIQGGKLFGKPQATSGTVRGVGISSKGILWTTSDDGIVRSYRNGTERTSTQVSGMENADLVMSGDVPVVVNSVTRQARLIDARSGEPGKSVCFDVPSDSASYLATSTRTAPWVIAAGASSGTLLVSSLDTGRCQAFVLGESSDEERYGRPVEKNRLVYVPDLRTGEVIVVDPLRDAPLRRVNSGLTGAATRNLALMVHGDAVWFDDPTGDSAGLITDDFNVIVVSKHSGQDQGRVIDQSKGSSQSSVGGDQRVKCSVFPSSLGVGQAATIRAITAPGVAAPDRYEWSFPGGNPTSVSGPRATTRFSKAGVYGASVKVSFGSEPLDVACPITVGGPASSANGSGPGGEAGVGSQGTAGTSSVSEGSPSNAGLPVQPGTPVGPDGGTGGTPGTPPVLPEIVADPPTVIVGKPVTLTDATAGKHSVNGWKFEGAPDITAGSLKSSSIKVKWNTTGNFKATLTIDTDEGAKSKDLSVKVVPVPEVPLVNGFTLDEARKRVVAMGLKPKDGAVRDSLLPSGYVEASTPAVGTPMDSGAVVELHASSGQSLVTTYASSPTIAAWDLAIDPSGVLFASSGEGNRIYRVLPNGVYEPYAGTGQSGEVDSGDNGPALNARFNWAGRMAFDKQGNLYVTTRTRVRKIDAVSKQISTVVGNGVEEPAITGIPAKESPLSVIYDVMVDDVGRVHVLTLDGRRPQRILVVQTNGILTEVMSPAVPGPAMTSLVFDTKGELYSNSGLQSISRFNGSAHVKIAPFSTGSEVPGKYKYILGHHFDSDGRLYFSTQLRIYRIGPSANFEEVTGGDAGEQPIAIDGMRAKDARYGGFGGWVVDGRGNLLISDEANKRIHWISCSPCSGTPPTDASGRAVVQWKNLSPISPKLMFPLHNMPVAQN